MKANAKPTLAGLTLDPRNLNAGTEEGRALVRTSLEKFGAGRSIVVDRNGVAIAGNKTLEQAKALGMEAQIVQSDGSKLVVVQRTDLDAKEEKAVALGFADNQSSSIGLSWNPETFEHILAEMPNAFAGLASDEQLREIMGKATQGLDATYSNKIVVPIYEPKGECPPVSELLDHRKTDELLAGIKKAKLPAETAAFLRLAAERHTVFNFRQIAEFYCHADKTVQDLMEKSGLVIIDFKKAIENGFVHLTEQLGALADQEEFDEG